MLADKDTWGRATLWMGEAGSATASREPFRHHVDVAVLGVLHQDDELVASEAAHRVRTDDICAAQMRWPPGVGPRRPPRGRASR